MSTAVRRVHYTMQDYVLLEEGSAVRHEFCDGEIYAMAGGTPDHAALAGALIGSLRARLPASCRVFSSDLRVCVVATGLVTYPDVTVVCGETERAAQDRNAVTNPQLVAEVTSCSTEEYDRGEKLRHYKEMPSLQEVVFVCHRVIEIEVHRRTTSGWQSTCAKAGEAVALVGGTITLSVDQVYASGLEDR